MATLWQRLGRAGRDPRMPSIAIFFADPRFFLPDEQECPEEYREFTQKVIRGDAASRNRVRDMISYFYKDKNPSQGVQTVTAHAQLDPTLLFYINTLGCRCRAALATFADSFGVCFRRSGTGLLR
jgi:hypothetical protein